ncbi:MAG: methyl-accepting chemotaxis protein [Treponema sp.]|jgi:methyl-accepting chemotaxis protein|nr:methyl-accepting chemotaxis protein [Treponema sp.]
MKIKFKLSIMMIAIVVVVAGSIALIQLRQASNISLNLSKQGIEYLTGQRGEYWKGRIDGFLQEMRTLANIMGDYENYPAENRRLRFDDMFKATVQADANLYQVYTVWKPDVLEGMDSRYIGRVGSSETGQYAIAFIKEDGQITSRATGDIADATAYLNGPNARKERVEHPVARNINGKDTYYVRMMVPIFNHRNNEVVGGVGCLMVIDLIQPLADNLIRTHKEIDALSIYSSNGFILACSHPEKIGKTLTDVESHYGDQKSAANEAVRAGNNFDTYSYSPDLGMHLQICIYSFQIGNSDTTWSIMLGAGEDHIMKDVRIMEEFTAILAVIAIAAAIVIVYLTLNATIKPIVKVVDTLKDISEGEGDLTRTIAAGSKDEIGNLALYFNKTLEKIKNLIITIKKEAANLQNIGNDLASNMTKTAAAVNQITANIQSIKGRVINQSASVTETNATMEQVVANINKLNGHVENQTSNVSQASSAIEEMVANISSVTNTLVNNAANVKNLQEASEVGRGGLQEVSSDIQEIARESEGLMEINSVMENIASQTNLLSMNAAIEAAHAGEAGKGFAVVADEIRKLAESSSEQSKTIGNVLKKIKASIEKISKSTENVLTRFESIDSGVKTVADQEGNIRNAMEEQGEGSKQVLQSAGSLNEITQNVKSGSEEMLEGSKEVMHESRNLERITQEITGGMNEMASGAEEINVAVNNVSDISNKNREGIDTLMREVSKFKVE